MVLGGSALTSSRSRCGWAKVLAQHTAATGQASPISDSNHACFRHPGQMALTRMRAGPSSA